MIYKAVARVDYMKCECGRTPTVVEVRRPGGTYQYRVEAVCCQTQTVFLSTQQAAINEFQRILGVQYADKMRLKDESTV